MKKQILLLFLSFMLPSYALCPVTGGESVCSIGDIRQPQTMIIQNQSENTNLNNPTLQLQPLERKDPIDTMRTPTTNMNYNSGCQFGMCLQNPNNKIEGQ